MVARFWRDIAGSVLVEYSIVFPVFLLVTLGTVDATYMLADWAMANKAVYLGARTAIVTSPVATGITSTNQGTTAGAWCFNFTDGTPTGNCPSSTSVCTGSATGGSCTNGYTFDNSAFTCIYDPADPACTAPAATLRPGMKQIFPALRRSNVQISYQTTGDGYALHAGGLPMTVTVSINCMTHSFYFLNALMHWVFSPPAGCTGTASGPRIPAFATALTSEDMDTN
jgi:Flp pilus assembly protein TadG